MGVSAAHATVFYEEIVKNGEVWAIRDAGGLPAPLNGDGDRSMPFWSLRSRAERVIANVSDYRVFEPMAIPLDAWRTRWIDGLERSMRRTSSVIHHYGSRYLIPKVEVS